MGSCKSSNINPRKERIQIVVFLGSNSSGSIHKILVDQISLASIFSDKPFKVIVPKLTSIPFFNRDLIKQHKIPQSVKELISLAQRANSFIFVTPQYNGAVSSTILNTYQWISEVPRARGKNSDALYHKPIGIMSCSYISQNQVKDIKLMTKTSNVKFFAEPFYVDLKQHQINPETRTLSPKLGKRFDEWLHQFERFI